MTRSRIRGPRTPRRVSVRPYGWGMEIRLASRTASSSSSISDTGKPSSCRLTSEAASVFFGRAGPHSISGLQTARFHDPEVREIRAAEGRFAILPAVPATVGAWPRRDMPNLSETQSSSTPEGEIAAIYRARYPLLEFVALRKFRIPEADVSDVIHEVVVAFIRARHRVHDERAWLIGATCNACRLYWRAHGRESEVFPVSDDEDVACAPDDIVQRVDVSAALRRLPRRCREVIHLRFYEEYTSQQIATHFATTIDYARKMVYRCVAAARALLGGIARRPR